MGEEWDCNDGPPLVHHSTSVLLLWCPGLLLQTFLAVELLISVLSGCLFTAGNCTPWICVLNPAFQHPAPLPLPRHPSPLQQQETNDSGCAVAQTVQAVLALSCLPQTIAVFPFDPPKFFFCPSWFPHHEGVFLSSGTSHLQLPTSGAGPFSECSFFFFLSFHPTQ